MKPCQNGCAGSSLLKLNECERPGSRKYCSRRSAGHPSFEQRGDVGLQTFSLPRAERDEAETPKPKLQSFKQFLNSNDQNRIRKAGKENASPERNPMELF
jgi:hypothetical protein